MLDSFPFIVTLWLFVLSDIFMYSTVYTHIYVCVSHFLTSESNILKFHKKRNY